MKRLPLVGFAVLILIAATALALQAQRPEQGPVVHEWGTFLAMSGSDGVTLEGMYHEEHALPSFVHSRSRDQLRIPSVILKGETPVIYFYTDRLQKVRVDVRFPTGLWTQWYPQAQVVSPGFSQARSPVAARDGRIRWCAQIIPAGSRPPNPPDTSSDALWNHARDVDAAFVQTTNATSGTAKDEFERFLFYRGLGEAPMPLRFRAEDGGTLASSDDRHGAEHVFVLRVEGGKGTYAYRPRLAPKGQIKGAIPSLDDAEPLDAFSVRIGRHLEQCLVASGLYPKEARAMVNTWRTSYFRTEGIRALVVLPQAWTDRFIPLEITPRPRELVRVMVGRLELLTTERERQAEAAVSRLASNDPVARQAAFTFLRDQGRYVEPIVRRVLATAADEAVRRSCRQLLAADFVTDLRASLHAAADGGRAEDDPAFIRAQLACVLRDIGMKSEAMAEGKLALETLRSRREPPMTDADSRGYLRAMARALEATGDAAAAAACYGRFIDFGSQIATNTDCRFCHKDTGPTEMAWFRDWWAGRKFAALSSASTGKEPAIADQQSALARTPLDIAARMKLAYLLDAAGESRRAAELWTNIAGRQSPGAPAVAASR
jgi:hypothetical protein